MKSMKLLILQTLANLHDDAKGFSFSFSGILFSQWIELSGIPRRHGKLQRLGPNNVQRRSSLNTNSVPALSSNNLLRGCLRKELFKWIKLKVWTEKEKGEGEGKVDPQCDKLVLDFQRSSVEQLGHRDEWLTRNKTRKEWQFETKVKLLKHLIKDFLLPHETGKGIVLL